MSARWAAWFCVGVRGFGLSPSDFWALSLAEWRALCAETGASASPPDRASLAALQARYPDSAGACS